MKLFSILTACILKFVLNILISQSVYSMKYDPNDLFVQYESTHINKFVAVSNKKNNYHKTHMLKVNSKSGKRDYFTVINPEEITDKCKSQIVKNDLELETFRELLDFLYNIEWGFLKSKDL